MATPVLWGTSDILVNTLMEAGQGDPQVVALKDGTFLAVWADSSKGSADWDVRAQIFNADGTKKGTEFVVNGRAITTGGGDTAIVTTGGQQQPKVAVLSDGRFVVTWVDTSGYGVDGTPGTEDQGRGIRARIFNADGTASGGDFWVNTTRVSDQYEPSIAALSNGGFVITYTSVTGFEDTDLKAQAFDANGNMIGGTSTSKEVTVNATTLYRQSESTVVGLANGKYAVFYTDQNSGSLDDKFGTIRGAIFNADGSISTPEFLVPSSRETKRLPSVTSLTNGKFVVTWTHDDANTGDGSGRAVKAQMFNADGTKFGGEFVANSITDFSQWDACVVALPDGGFAISYTSGFSEMFVQGFGVAVFDAKGNRTGADFLYALPPGAGLNYGAKSSLTALADGRLVLSWGEYGSVSSGRPDANGVYARILDPRDKAITVTGATLDDQYVGTKYADTLSGKAGADRLYGGDGDDTLVGGAGGDILDGGAGRDTASYIDAGSGVVANLETTALNLGDAENDIYISIENLTGSSFKDKLTGNGADNVLDGGDDDDSLAGGGGQDTLIGGKGNDDLNGGTGADTLIGGQGDDTYTVDSADDKVEEKAGEGYDVVTSSVSYALDVNAEVEELHAAAGSAPINLSGSNTANKIYGNSAANILDGGLGADILQGGAGNDTYIIDNAGDSIVEVAGDDQGYDKVIIAQDFQADHTYNLTAFQHVEAIEALNSAGEINLVGNSGSNLIIGNDSKNLLDGGADSVIDTLQGGKGDDTYVIRENDIIIESAGQGTDTALVLAANYELGKDISIEVLKADKAGGASSFRLTGNNLANTIEGADGSDVLDGGGSATDAADKLDGGDGSDIYYVRRSHDTVVEAEGMGAEDKIFAYANYVLLDSVHVEIMEAVAGNAKINLTGNSWANKLIGNAGDNVLEGGGGNDDIDGGGGFNTAVFSGKRAEYTLRRNGDGTYTVTDATAGRDGTDTLRNIKYARFSDEIVDLDAPATMSIVADSAVKSEGNSGWTEYTFTISRTSGHGEATVTWRVVGTGANSAADEDFEVPIAELTETVIFTEGQTTKSVVVRVKADTLDEENETFNVVLSGLSGAVMGSSTASGLIINDDAPVTMSVSAADAAKYEGDTGYTDYTFTVSRSSGKGSASATWVVTGIDGGVGTASADEFEALTGVVNFAADEVTQTITVRVKGDRNVEANEAFSVKLTGASGAVISMDTANGTIINDDAVPLLSIAAADAAKIEGDSGYTEHTFTISRSSGDVASSVRWTVVGSGANPAALGEFDLLTDVVTFAKDELTKTIRIRVKADTEVESDETFSVVLSDPVDATIGVGSAIGTIINDDVLNVAPANIRLTTGGTTAILDENKGAGSVVATVTADDDGGTPALRYSLVTANGNFEIDEITGQIKVKAGADLNYEGVKIHTLSVRVRDLNGTGLDSVQDITINLADVNEAPVLGAAVTALTISENAVLDDTVASFTLDDIDAGENFVYEILGVPAAFAGAFAVDAANKRIVVADASKLSVTSTQSFTFTLRVKDKNGGAGSLWDTQDFTVTIQDIPAGNTGPKNIRLTTGEAEAYIDENLSAGQTVAHVMADDNGPAGELRYYLADNAYFVIDERSGEIKVKGGTRLSYEDLPNGKYTVAVTVKDLNGVGATSTRDIVINIDDVNEAATGINFTDRKVVKAGATLTGDKVVLASAVDPDTKEIYRDNLYLFANGTNTHGIFTIDVVTGQITINRAVTSKDVGDHLLKVVAYDAQNKDLARTTSYTIAVEPADNQDPTVTEVVASGKGEAGAGTDAGTFVIFESEGAGVVADVNASDNDGDMLTYSLAGANGDYNGLFSIAADGRISITDPAALNLNADKDYVLTVQVSDGRGGIDTETVTIRVKNVVPANPAPSTLLLNGGTEARINEFEALDGVSLGFVSASDPGDSLRYSLVDNGGGLFSINESTGQVVVVGGLNFEQAASHQIKVRATDSAGQFVENVFTILVNDQWNLNKRGTKKNDKMNGSALDDILKGGTKSGKDTIKGLDGDDKLYGEGGNDKVYGGNGIDFVRGDAGNDKVYGDAGNDKVYGGAGNDSVYGGAGDDKVYGDAGNDTVKGDAGNDTIYGGAGNDKLYGGAGKDTFVFNTKANKTSNLDQVKDFKVVDDTIWLDNKYFTKLGKAGSEAAPAALNKDFFKVGAKAKDRNDYIVYDKKSGILYYDADGSGKKAAVEIAKLGKNLKLTADDFMVI